MNEAALNIVPLHRKLFQPSQLTIARRMAGLSKTALGDRLGVSHAAISQFEAGTSSPSEQRQHQLADALGFPIQFFALPSPASEHDDAFFRRRRKTSSADLQKALSYTDVVAMLVRQLEEFVDLPEVDIPTIRVSERADREEVEQAAAAARKALGVTPGPAPRLARFLETKGCVVVRNSDIGPTVDAFSRIVGGRPVIVLNTAKADTMRTRFDLAHELGHLVMHATPSAKDTTLERQADQFAAAFLMPEQDIRQHLPTTPQWHAFLQLKERWGVSAAALVRRARDLGLMSEHHYKRAQIELRTLKWHKNEPFSGNGTESPTLWKKCLEVLSGAVELHHIAQESGIPTDMALTALGLSPSIGRPSVSL